MTDETKIETSEQKTVEPVQRKLGVTVARHYGPVTVTFSVESLEVVSNLADQHNAFERLLLQMNFEHDEFSRNGLLKQDDKIAHSNKKPGGTVVSYPALRAEIGTHNGQVIYKVYCQRYIKYGVTLYKEQFQLTDIEQVMADAPVKDLSGWTVFVDEGGKYPKVVGLTKD